MKEDSELRSVEMKIVISNICLGEGVVETTRG